MYCDIGYLETIDLTMVGQLSNIQKLGPLALKGYLYPPSIEVKCLPGNLDVVFKEI